MIHVFRQVFDTDEPAHLHVAWAWTRGLVPYRDVFANHAPLFHLLSAPVVAAVGERASLLFVARLAMLPLFAGILWLVFDIGRLTFSRRMGLWAAVFLGFYPEPFIISLEFRSDVLWTLFWLLSLRAALAGPPTPRRGFRAGLWLGAALSVSMKTTVLGVSSGVAAILLLLVSRDARGEAGRRPVLPTLAAAVSGALVLPLACIALFAALGALGPMAYGAIGYNLESARDIASPSGGARAAALAGLALVVAGCAWVARRPWPLGTRLRVAFVALAAGMYVAMLLGLWPVSPRQTWMPVQPMIALLATPVFLAVADRLVAARGGAKAVLAIALVAVVIEAGFLETRVKPWRNRAQEAVGRVAETLRLTDPSDLVLDAKGETVFRPRPVRENFESLWIARLARGEVEDRLPEVLTETRTCVAVEKLDRFPRRARAFLERQYLPVGTLRVAGTLLDAPPAGPLDPATFDLAIPARYALVEESGAPIRGTLDGTPYDGPRALSAGRHEFRPASPSRGRIACIWAQAVERGFSPFPRAAPPAGP